MPVDWQTLLVLLIVCGAALALIRRAVRLFTAGGHGPCGGGSCNSCSQNAGHAGPQELPLVSLNAAPPSDAKPRR